MKFDSVDSLRSEGFEGFRSVKELILSCSDVPTMKGNYLVLYLGVDPPHFLSKGVGGFFKRKDPNVDISQLVASWVNGAIVIYIGQVGGVIGYKRPLRILKNRISEYLKFGQGKPVGHYGGRYIWQIQEHQDLVLCWRPCINDKEDPKMIESDLLGEFKAIYGKSPFANLPK